MQFAPLECADWFFLSFYIACGCGCVDGQTHACKCLLWSEGGLGLDRLDLELQVVSDPLHPGGRNYRCSSPLNPLPSPTLRTVLTVSVVEKLSLQLTSEHFLVSVYVVYIQVCVGICRRGVKTRG